MKRDNQCSHVLYSSLLPCLPGEGGVKEEMETGTRTINIEIRSNGNGRLIAEGSCGPLTL